MEDTLRQALKARRGMTLVELMIVVAIIGVLASLAGVAFNRQVKRAKITKLEQYAMEIAKGQEDFYSRHGVYYPVNDTASGVWLATSGPNEITRRRWRNALGFDRRDGPPEMRAQVFGGTIDDNCDGDCADYAELLDATGNPNKAWYVVVVEQDMDPSDTTVRTQVIISSTLQNPVIRNEGQ